jgi:hypothetical protein
MTPPAGVHPRLARRARTLPERMSRVGAAHYSAAPPSEPCGRISPHTAQAAWRRPAGQFTLRTPHMGGVLRSVHHSRAATPPRPWRLTCPSARVSVRLRLAWPSAHVSSLSGRACTPVSGQLSESGRRRSRAVPVSCRLSVRRHSLVGHPFPPIGVGPYGRLTGHVAMSGPRRGSTFRTHKTRPGRMPSLPRDSDALPPGTPCPAGTCRFAAASPVPRCCVPSAGVPVTRHCRGFTCVHLRSSPCL